MAKSQKRIATKSLWRRWRRNYLSPSIRPRFSRKAERRGEKSTCNLNDKPPGNDLPPAQGVPSKLEPPNSPTPNEEGNVITVDTTPKQTTEVLLNNDIWSLTPPSSSPAPLVVSAKRLSSEIRFKHSKKHRGRLADRTNAPKLESSNNLLEWRDKSDYSNNASLSTSSEDEEEKEELGIDVTLLSPTERSKYYWKICYGSTNPLPQQQIGCWSAQRAPTKSCLSSTKTRRRTSFPCSLPSGIPSNTPTLPPRSNSITQCFQTPILKSLSRDRKVQFGALSAAEFNRDAPTSSAIKPLTPVEAQKLFSPTKTKTEEDDETTLLETKSNSKILAQWEDDFDEYLSESDGEEEEDDGYGNMLFFSDPKRCKRRSSSLFSPTGQALLATDSTEDEMRVSGDEKSLEKDDQDTCLDRGLGDIDGLREQTPPVDDFWEWNEFDAFERHAKVPRSETFQSDFHYEPAVKECVFACWSAISKRLRNAVPHTLLSELDSDKLFSHGHKKEIFHAAQAIASQELEIHHFNALQAIQKELVQLKKKLDKEIQDLDKITRVSTIRFEKLSLLRLELDREEIESDDKLVRAHIDRKETTLDLEIQHNEILRHVVFESFFDPNVDVINTTTVRMNWELRNCYVVDAIISVVDGCNVSLIEKEPIILPGDKFMKLMLQETKDGETEKSSLLSDSSLLEKYVSPRDTFLYFSTFLGRINMISSEIDLLGENTEIREDKGNANEIIVSFRDVKLYFGKGSCNLVRVDGQISSDEKGKLPSIFSDKHQTRATPLSYYNHSP